MQKTRNIRLKSDILTKYDLPDMEYSVPLPVLESALSGGAPLPFTEMLVALQERGKNGDADWKTLESAMDRLTQLIAPSDERTIISATGDNWWIEVGPVNLDAKIVTIQRENELVAAIAKRDDGRLRVATFRPLDFKSAAYLISMGQNPHPQYGVSMRENNWEYALDCSAGTGNAYADMRGEAYLSYWEKGIGVLHNDEVDPAWRAMKNLLPRPAVYAVVELGVHYSFSKEEDADENDENSDVSQEDTAQEVSQTHFQWRCTRQQPQTVRERFIGCLLGGAAGDALGAPVEFMSRAAIIERFGPRGITNYAPAYGGIGTITDDTQMTLFTAEGLIRARVRHAFKGISHAASVVDHAYQRWLLTQNEHSRSSFKNDDADGWLFQHLELRHRRAPGNTCLSALKIKERFGYLAENTSKGCGGVMRVAPIGLASLGMKSTPEQTFRLGAEVAELTHGHPTSSLSSGVLAVLIQALADGVTLPEGLRVAKSILRTHDFYEETLSALELAEELSSSSLAPLQCITRLGEGWIAEEALAISVYCALVARSFKQGVILAVNHGGDSDSTGAITGNLLGAMYGVKSIPSAWLEGLELCGVIAELAEDLHEFMDWDIGEHSKNVVLNEAVWKKYPGW